MLVFSLVTRWIENIEERENKRISMEKHEENEEDGGEECRNEKNIS